MASILARHVGARYRVSVRGALTWKDLARLEAACGPALEFAVVPLDLDVSRVSMMDGPALAYLERLFARGARIVDRSPDA